MARKGVVTTKSILTFHGLGVPAMPVCNIDPAMWLATDTFAGVLAELGPTCPLTFDDGFRSCWEIAVPMLLLHGLKATFFVTVAQLGKDGYLSPRHCRDMLGLGMKIGSHGMQHRGWRGLGAAALAEEIAIAQDRLEQVLGVRVTEAACPFGAYDRRSLRALRLAGFQKVYTSDRLPAYESAWLSPRYTVRRGDTVERLSRLLQERGGPRIMARRLRCWLKRLR